MKKKNLLIIACTAWLISSCTNSEVKSLQPFFTDETAVKKSSIEGDWLVASEDTSDIIRIERFTYHRNPTTTVHAYKVSALKVKQVSIQGKIPNGNRLRYAKGSYYLYVNHPAKNEKLNFMVETPPALAHLFKLDNQQYYLDLTRFSNTENTDYSISVHNIAKLSIKKNCMMMYLASTDFFNKSLKENMVKIPLQMVNDISTDGGCQSKALLTAEPKQLQRFIVKYNNQLFDSTSLAFPLRRIIHQ